MSEKKPPTSADVQKQQLDLAQAFGADVFNIYQRAKPIFAKIEELEAERVAAVAREQAASPEGRIAALEAKLAALEAKLPKDPADVAVERMQARHAEGEARP